MTARRSVKGGPQRCRLVGVIASADDFRVALRMKEPPDLFELRLDHLIEIENEIESRISRLRAPVIITARHPAEGGARNLSARRRRELLLRFLPRARYIDVELRSVRTFRSLLDAAHRKNVRRIISFHHFGSTPSSRSLRAKARLAKRHGADVFKVATRTDRPDQLARLLEFVSIHDRGPAVSAMGMGKLGAVSRLVLARAGSVFIYGSLRNQGLVEGQILIQRLRSALEAVG